MGEYFPDVGVLHPTSPVKFPLGTLTLGSLLDEMEEFLRESFERSKEWINAVGEMLRNRGVFIIDVRSLITLPHFRDHKHIARVLENGSERLQVGRWFPNREHGRFEVPPQSAEWVNSHPLPSTLSEGRRHAVGRHRPHDDQGPRHCRRPFTGYDPSASL